MFGLGIPELLVVFVPICISLLIFLVLREFWCWYLKQNKIVSLLEDIRDLMENQINMMPLREIDTTMAEPPIKDPDVKYKPLPKKTLASSR
jgi:hypothetical protein